ncbi:MAG: UDP-N-acetylmuramoylalanyl-D-glutamyl-2,6-diaminopimelate--D-alanyl-D-alanyl ligase [Candidatus Kaiserbacteria bacterium]|nr:UDP-N-acetylmuramoylalanyl-D-glutamyl-2,6-diaminopimelate--D-alanyl-D-alanyl ligase [Candidatus Kaiserbacteria bacterium]
MQFLKQCVILILTWEARLVLLRHKPRIIAVTGSVGKTTTKDAIFSALAGVEHVRKSAKSFNSDVGVPLTILGLDNAWSNPFKWLINIFKGALVIVQSDYPKWLVLEVGADRPGDIKRIAQWLRPDIAVITGVPEIPVHVEYFNSPEDVVREKRALAEHLKPGGKLILNGDDARMREIHGAFRGYSVTYGIENNNEFFASHEEVLYENGLPAGMQFRVDHKGSSVPVSVYGALGRPRIYAALAAIAVADVVGIDTVTAASALAGWEAPPGRVRIIQGMKGSMLIDDTYNSSPSAALAALDTLRDTRATRRIAVLGDMLELGKYSKEAHKQVGERAASCADILITIGFRARAMAEGALDGGMRDESIRQYERDDSARATDELLAQVKEGDVILVKGSQGMRMERIVRALMNDPEQAPDLLVRMDREWQFK